MPQSYFRYRGPLGQRDPAGELASSVSREFYLSSAFFKGDLRALEFNNRKSVAGSVPIFATTFNGRAICGVERSWNEIRLDSRHFFLLWFPVYGTVSIRQNQMETEIGTGEFAVTFANRPLSIETRPDAADRHESYQVAVPAHRMNNFLPGAETVAGSGFRLETGNLAFAKRTYMDLFEHADDMSDRAIASFSNAALEGLCESIRGECLRHSQAHRIKAVRIRMLHDHVVGHLSDPGLSADDVARGCGVSIRYLHLLFQEDGTSFHDFVWKHRLDAARAKLNAAGDLRPSISHIAASSGFRSVSHFSRAYKSAFGHTPTEARQRPVRA